MSITTQRKAELIKQYQRGANDTGSAEVQVAVLTERIKNLTEHMKEHKQDFDTRKGLLKLVNQRRSLLGYLKKIDLNRYKTIVESLGLRR